MLVEITFVYVCVYVNISYQTFLTKTTPSIIFDLWTEPRRPLTCGQNGEVAHSFVQSSHRNSVSVWEGNLSPFACPQFLDPR